LREKVLLSTVLAFGVALLCLSSLAGSSAGVPSTPSGTAVNELGISVEEPENTGTGSSPIGTNLAVANDPPDGEPENTGTGSSPIGTNLAVANDPPDENHRTLEVGSGKEFENIQDAIDNASPGDTVLVYPGTYEERLTVEVDNLTLRSVDGPKSTIINGRGKDILEVHADNVTIDGFTIENGTHGISLYKSNGCKVINNVITHCMGMGEWWKCDGLSLNESHYNIIENNFITRCCGGIGGQFSTHNLIVNNVVTHMMGPQWNFIALYFVNSCNYNRVENNIFENNQEQYSREVWLIEASSAYNTFANNIVRFNWAGPKFKGWDPGSAAHNNTLINNIIANNLGFGIQLRLWTSNNYIAYNIIENNGGPGIIAQSGQENNTVIYNKIEGNAIGIINETPNPVDARKNWFGDPTGPSGLGSGFGDGVTENVKYSPWLATEPGVEPEILGYSMEITAEEKVENAVEPEESVEVTIRIEAENLEVIPSVVASPYYGVSLKPNQLKTSPAEWTFKVWPTGEAAGKDIKVRFELYAEHFWRGIGPIPMTRGSITLHVSS